MKNKKHEIILAELGDELLTEKIRLEKELDIIKRRIKSIDEKIKKDKFKNKMDKTNTYFFKFTARERNYAIIKRLKEINRELKK
jgi:hypothetical protein